MSCIGTPGISLFSKWIGLKQASNSYYRITPVQSGVRESNHLGSISG